MQDVCICFRTDAGQDMISKVTDICSTDPTDPSHCASPEDIKLPRTKVAVIRGMTDEILMDNPELNGDADTQEMWWSPCKCLGEVCTISYSEHPVSSHTLLIFGVSRPSSNTHTKVQTLTTGSRPLNIPRTTKTQSK